RNTYVSGVGDRRLTTIGLFFVSPEFRGISLGLELWNRIDDGAEGSKTVIATPRMGEKYRRLYGYEKVAETVRILEVNVDDIVCGGYVHTAGIAFRAPFARELTKLFEYDETFLDGFERGSYLRDICRRYDAYLKAAFDKNDNIVGYGVLRLCYDDRLAVGPLYADNADAAKGILHSLFTSVQPGTHMVIQYRLDPLNVPYDKVFSVSECGCPSFV
ncbi:Protein T24A6.20, partial [Aphelenchoides avenae]